MKLYGHATIGNPRRVTIYLLEKGIEVPLVKMDYAKLRSPEFLEKNPFARIPVLELDDGRYLSETIAICRYFEALHPDPPMFGIGPLDEAVVEMWQRRVELEIFMPTSQYIRHCAPELKPFQPIQIPEWGQLNRERAEAGLHIVDRQLAENEFVAGQRFTVADITLAHQLLGMPGATGIPVPDDCRHLARWLEAAVQRPSIANTQPPDYGRVQRIVPG